MSGAVKRSTIRKKVNKLREAIRTEGSPGIQEAWAAIEDYAGTAFFMKESGDD